MKLVLFALFIITQTEQCKKAKPKPVICFERGYVYNDNDHKLNVFLENGIRVNHKKVSSESVCISLCKRYGNCQWWNFDFEKMECFLHTRKGDKKIVEPKYINMYTGHRDSSRQCPEDWSWISKLEERPNPCPNGIININCYGDYICDYCCTGEQPGSDGTTACEF